MISIKDFFSEAIGHLLISYKDELASKLQLKCMKIPSSLTRYVPGNSDVEKNIYLQKSFLDFIQKLSEGIAQNENIFLLNAWGEHLADVETDGMIDYKDIMQLDHYRKICIYNFLEHNSKDVSEYKKLIEVTEEIFHQLSQETFSKYYTICYNKLLENNRQFMEVIECSSNGIMVYNKNFEIVIWNPRIEVISGLRKEEVIGKNFFDIFPNYRNTQEEALLLKVLEGKRYLLSERKIMNYKGFYHISVFPLQDDNKKSTGGVLILQDVTVKKEIEEKLKESEYFIQQMLDHTPDYIYLFDLKTTSVVFSNNRVKDILGYSSEEIKQFGASITELTIHPGDLPVIQKHREKINQLKDSDVTEMQFRFKRKDGQYIWVRTRGKIFKRDSSGNVWLTLNIGSDITDKKKIETELIANRNELARAYLELSKIYSDQIEINEELERRVEVRTRQLVESERQYRFLADTVPQIFWTCNSQGHADYFNSKWHEYTGLTFEESKMEGWLKALHPDDKIKALKAWKESASTGKNYEAEYRLRQKHDGKYLWHVARAAALKDEDGNVLKWFGTCIDIHDRRKAMEELKAKNKALREINNDLDNFIYTASHDLKTPISNIEGLINMIEFDLKQNQLEDIRYEMEMIRESILKFRITIKDLEEIGKIQRNNPKDITANFILAVIQRVSNLMKNELEMCGCQIELEENSYPYVYFSRSYFQSILFNLISNSIKYRSLDRKLIVLVKLEKIGEDTVALRVKDNGIGIPSSQKDKIFQMFKRAHIHSKGSGVGLYIVKRILDNNEGEIEVESEPGKGAAFTVYFRNQKEYESNLLYKER